MKLGDTEYWNRSQNNIPFDCVRIKTGWFQNHMKIIWLIVSASCFSLKLWKIFAIVFVRFYIRVLLYRGMKMRQFQNMVPKSSCPMSLSLRRYNIKTHRQWRKSMCWRRSWPSSSLYIQNWISWYPINLIFLTEMRGKKKERPTLIIA